MIITSIEEQKNNKNRKSIFIDGKYSFSVDDEDLFKLDLYPEKQITEQDIEYINEFCNFSKAKKQALRYITYRFRTAFEVQTMLRNKGYDECIIKRVVDSLTDLDYINDGTYAEKYVKDAYHLKKLGSRRVYLELQKKGVDEHIIQGAIDNIEFDEKQALLSMVMRKLQSINTTDEKAFNRVRNFFLRKGYSLRNINECINKYYEMRELD